jgi:phage terminase small subunit
MPALAPVRRTRTSVNDLNSSELLFVKHLIADDLWRPIEAAKRAGFKSPAAMASNLMKKPIIQAMLGKEQRRRLERLELKADEVLNVLATGLFFNPLSLFKPSASGKWVIEDLSKVPDEIGRIVEEVKVRTVETIDEDNKVTVTTYFELKTISKSKLLELAMKHCGVDGTSKIEYSGNVDLSVNFSLNQLLMDVENTRRGQIVDGRVLEVDHSG